MSQPTVGSVLNEMWIGVQFVGGLLIAGAAFAFFTGPSSSGLNMSNINATTRSVQFTIANSSEKTGDVLVSVQQGDIERCRYLVPIKANERLNGVKMPCPVAVGDFRMKAVWANSDRDRAAAANRLRL